MTTPDPWGMYEEKAGPKPIPPKSYKHLIANVIDDTEKRGDKQHEVTWYVPLEHIGDSVRQLTGGWPRVANGLLFVSTKSDGKPCELRYLDKTPALFAWMQEMCDLRWTNETARSTDDTQRTPATKEEFFQHLRHSSPQKYVGTAPMPHEPEIPGIYYLPPPELPQGFRCGEGEVMTGRLDEFVASLNAETEHDRELLKAMIVTMAWGGEPGARPAFALSSDRRGSGKTSTAEAICEIWGGAFEVKAKEKSEDVNKKLLSDSGLSKRCVLVDNVKGRLSHVDFEATLTRRVIEGHRMYTGYYTRPNFLTWIITSNTPKLSEDLSCRSVVIRIGKPKHGHAWIPWAFDFIREHKWEIVHDCLLVLRGPPLSHVSAAMRDRYQVWQDAVLCRCSPNADRLMCLVIERRADVNSDADDADEVADAICAWMTEKGLNPARDAVSISRDEMRDLLLKAKVIDDGFSKRAVHTWLSELRGSAPLHSLKDCKHKSRKWVWSPIEGQEILTDTEIPI